MNWTKTAIGMALLISTTAGQAAAGEDYQNAKKCWKLANGFWQYVDCIVDYLDSKLDKFLGWLGSEIAQDDAGGGKKYLNFGDLKSVPITFTIGDPPAHPIESVVFRAFGASINEEGILLGVASHDEGGVYTVTIDPSQLPPDGTIVAELHYVGITEVDDVVAIAYSHSTQVNPCPADFDSSGFVDLDDFIAFVGAFERGIIGADYDGSGFVDLDDFVYFVNDFEIGC